ncbi:MAG: tryptophan synthase subunit alpha [Candidatus Omnitrophica bacterium]|nr:tryptophan synthase subunit alpha [Candidatus Omnitrophota bacterium]MBU1810129.1 tryptophan synthase subunit alpha [Candidatus Omnitrophota bacterium]MBU2436400.1 tryptophan synthase subunit alpha [Candidatus Omnitrophota bacterium]
MRIEEKFKQLKKEGKKAFIAYIPFGFPKIGYTKDIILALQASGVDMIELGVPFSDPLADGPIIQKAASLALKQGADIEKLFITLEGIKKSLKIPLVIMTYYNPLFKFGIEKFFTKMQAVEVSGIIVVDLPHDESRNYIEKTRKFDLETVFFITPTTSKSRQEKIVKISQGFIYYISVTGITGPKSFTFTPLTSYVKDLKKITELPICVGFGVHTPLQVEKIRSFSDGVIVGSGIVEFIGKHFRQKNFLNKLKTYVNFLNGREYA